METADRVGELLERLLTRIILEPSRRIAAAGITVAQLKVLRFLHAHGGAASLKEVATSLGISSSTATELVEKGVEHGFIRRVKGPVDRRMCRLTLLAAGTRVLAALERERRQRVRRLLSRVDDRALDLARVALETLDHVLSTDGMRKRPGAARRS